MAVILPLATWGLLWRVFFRREQDWREAVITASLVWGVLVVALTEALSLVRLLSFPWLALAWGVILLSLFVIDRRSAPVSRSSAQEPYSKREWFLIGVIAAVLVVTGITAVVAPPNTWDSMTYHMTRAAFWMQNATVEHYPTQNIRQLLFPPFAEYAILQTLILSGGDRWANLIQWFSMSGSLIVVSLLARQLGTRREGQLYAAALTATLPMSILQASSTQNDYVVTFWLLCLTFLILRAVQNRLNWMDGVWIGICIGLVLLSKATGYVFGLTLIGATGLIALWQWRLRAWQILGVIGLCALLLNATFYIRNIQSFGSLFGSSQSQGESFNGEFSPRVMLSNVMRNTAMHIMIVPNRLDEALHFHERVQGLIEAAHAPLQLSPSDPRTTFGIQTFAVPTWNTSEDTAGNPVHLVVFVIAFGLFVWHRDQRRWPLMFLGLLLSHIVVFCTLLRWMTWISRFHLFLFALMMAFAAVILIQRRVLPYLLLVVALPISLGPLFNTETRPWIEQNSLFTLPRENQYFVAARQLGQEMRLVADMMGEANCSQIGIVSGGDQWVYPLFVMMKEARIEYLGYEGYPRGDFTPCGIIVYKPFDPGRYELFRDGDYVEQKESLSFFQVYLFEERGGA